MSPRPSSRQGDYHGAEALANSLVFCTEATFGNEAYSALSVAYGNLASLENKKVRIYFKYTFYRTFYI